MAALVVFAVVQDRVTAAGAQRYVRLQEAALARGDRPIDLETIMRPAVARSVRLASLWSGGVLLAGFVTAAIAGRRARS
jgi:hypothetical protein